MSEQPKSPPMPWSPSRSPSFLSPNLRLSDDCELYTSFPPLCLDPVPPFPLVEDEVPLTANWSLNSLSPILSPIFSPPSFSPKKLMTLPLAPKKGADVIGVIAGAPYKETQYKAKAVVQGRRVWDADFKRAAKEVGIVENPKQTKKPDTCLYLFNEKQCSIKVSSPSTLRKGRKQAKTVKSSNWSSVQYFATGKVTISAQNEAGAKEAWERFSQLLVQVDRNMRVVDLKPSQITVHGKFNVEDITYADVLARAHAWGVACCLTEKRAPELKFHFPKVGKVRLWSTGSFQIMGCLRNEDIHKVYLKVKALVFDELL